MDKEDSINKLFKVINEFPQENIKTDEIKMLIWSFLDAIKTNGERRVGLEWVSVNKDVNALHVFTYLIDLGILKWIKIDSYNMF